MAVVQLVVNLASPVDVVVTQLLTVLTAGVEQMTVDLGVPLPGGPGGPVTAVVVVLGVPVAGVVVLPLVMVEVMTEVVVIVLQIGVGVVAAVAHDVVIATPPPTLNVAQLEVEMSHETVLKTLPETMV